MDHTSSWADSSRSGTQDTPRRSYEPKFLTEFSNLATIFKLKHINPDQAPAYATVSHLSFLWARQLWRYVPVDAGFLWDTTAELGETIKKKAPGITLR